MKTWAKVAIGVALAGVAAGSVLVAARNLGVFGAARKTLKDSKESAGEGWTQRLIIRAHPDRVKELREIAFTFGCALDEGGAKSDTEDAKIFRMLCTTSQRLNVGAAVSELDDVEYATWDKPVERIT